MSTKNRTIVRAKAVMMRLCAILAPGLAARWLERGFLTPSRHPLRPGDGQRLAAADHRAVAFDGARRMPVHVRGRGPTALLVHGWSGRGAQMGAMADALVEAGYRAVVYDAPGHGAADGRLSGLPEMAAAIERVADAVGPPSVLVAHSLGAAAATIAVGRGLPVDRLVYIAPPDDPGLYLHGAARKLGFGSAVARRAQARIERRFDFPFAAARGTDLAPRLNVPLLVIHDEADPLVPYALGKRLTRAWPGARLMKTTGLGHHRILRDPAVVAAAVGFLAADRLQQPPGTPAARRRAEG